MCRVPRKRAPKCWRVDSDLLLGSEWWLQILPPNQCVFEVTTSSPVIFGTNALQYRREDKSGAVPASRSNINRTVWRSGSHVLGLQSGPRECHHSRLCLSARNPRPSEHLGIP